MQGQIIKIINEDCYVEAKDKTYICKPRGKLRNDNVFLKVGDYVTFDEKNNYILTLNPRKNDLERPNVANIDQAFIITSLKEPDFSSMLLDKLLILCEYNNIKPIICLTKKDLLAKDEINHFKKIFRYYKSLGYKVLYNTNKYKIKKLFKNKTTVFTGQTGAGKSTLLNSLDKTLNFETGEISKALGRGKHTTRYVTLVNMYKGKVLDTPGFSKLDLTNLNDIDVKNSFKEFNKFTCPYKNCFHKNESNCRVKESYKNNKILKSRYENYLKILEKR